MIRWTAPRGGLYRAVVNLRGLEVGSQRTTSRVTVARGDTILALTSIGGDGGAGGDDGGARTLSFAGLQFRAGDTLDVRLDWGDNGT